MVNSRDILRDVLEHDTSLAQQEIERGSIALPSCMKSGVYTTLCATTTILEKRRFQPNEQRIIPMESLSSMNRVSFQ